MREMDEEVNEETVRNRAAQNMIHMASEETTRGVQEHLRDGNVTPAMNPVVVVVDGRRYLLSEINEDQLLVAQRKLGRHMAQPVRVELPNDARARQREATRIPLLRQIWLLYRPHQFPVTESLPRRRSSR